MLFQITKNNDCEWALTPLAGRFEGCLVATAEAVNMQGVKVQARSFVGTIQALWGVSVLDEGVYSDSETFRALRLGRAFNQAAEENLHIDYDGVYDSALHMVAVMDRLVVFGERIFGRNAR